MTCQTCRVSQGLVLWLTRCESRHRIHHFDPVGSSWSLPGPCSVPGPGLLHNVRKPGNWANSANPWPLHGLILGTHMSIYVCIHIYIYIILRIYYIYNMNIYDMIYIYIYMISITYIYIYIIQMICILHPQIPMMIFPADGLSMPSGWPSGAAFPMPNVVPWLDEEGRTSTRQGEIMQDFQWFPINDQQIWDPSLLPTWRHLWFSSSFWGGNTAERVYHTIPVGTYLGISLEHIRYIFARIR